ncbi:MAG: methionyl-tRNA formyltransferase [Limisphaerales bacterium]
MPLRIVFMGTSELACASLKALLASPEFEMSGVVTQPDRPKGRNLKLQPSPVKTIAIGAGLPVFQPASARQPDFLAELAALRPDMLVVAAYGQILPQSMLDLPRFGGVNVHASLLPKYRGAAPIQWAILNADAETGVTIMKIAAALDTGDVLSQRSIPILPEDNSATLHDRLSVLGAALLVPTILDYSRGGITPQPQAEAAASYARKITKEDGRMDWRKPAPTLWNQVRAFIPWPCAFTWLNEGSARRLLKIIRATVEDNHHGPPGEILQADKTGLVVACGQGALRINELQLEGGRKMTAAELLAGHSLRPGGTIG